MGISFAQYRAKIGTFIQPNGSKRSFHGLQVHQRSVSLCVRLLLLLSTLLVTSGSVERNPGPHTRQSTLQTGKDGSVQVDQGLNESNNDAMKKMLSELKCAMDKNFESLHTKDDNMASDMHEQLARLRTENVELHSRVKELEDKLEDLEPRSRRHNLIFHGLHGSSGETWDQSEEIVRSFLTDTLKMDEETIQAGICTSTTCRGMRCLETHAGKAVCFKGSHNETHSETMADTTLIEACSRGDFRRVKYILSQDTANVDSGDENDMTPAMIAAKTGRRDILELLVKEGADLSLSDNEERNVLHVACMEGHMKVVKYIHSLNIIDIESGDNFETTPLMFAAESGKLEVFSFLIKIGADVSKEDENGENIFHYSCRGEHVEIMNFILTQNILKIDCIGKYGMTPLMSACYGNGTAFDFLISRGADTLAEDDDNRNILHHASRGGNVAIVKYILTHKVWDVNSRCLVKMTPLMYATFQGKLEVLDVLIERGADTSAVDFREKNILHHSCSGGSVESVNYVLKLNVVSINSKQGDGKTAVLVAALKSNREVFDILVKQGADLSVVDEDGNNILHFACKGGSLEMVKHVLTLNIVDINSRGAGGMTPLLIAVNLNEQDMFDLLMEGGADPSVVNTDGKNILHLACQEGNVDIVKYVMSHDIVDITSKTTQGLNAATIARYFGYSAITKLLSQTSQGT